MSKYEERGCKKKKKRKRNEGGGRGVGGVPPGLINTRPPDRKWPGQLKAPGELPSGAEAVEEFSCQENLENSRRTSNWINTFALSGPLHRAHWSVVTKNSTTIILYPLLFEERKAAAFKASHRRSRPHQIFYWLSIQPNVQMRSMRWK